MTQHTLMKFDPATGWSEPYPSHAEQWRAFNGQMAWLFNPWTGQRRHAADVGSDPLGRLIAPPLEQIEADSNTVEEGPQPDGTLTFKVDLSRINDLQLDSLRRAITRAKLAHMVDLDIRINGQNEHIEADWLKHFVEVTA